MPSTYHVGQITEITTEKRLDEQSFVQELYVRLQNGETFFLQAGDEFQPLSAQQRLKTNQKVVVVEPDPSLGPEVSPAIADLYRLPMLSWLLIGFVVLVAVVGRLRGLLALAGMMVSLVVLTGWLIPQLLAGADPTTTSLLAAVVIATITIYLSHGWKVSSHVALGSLLFTLFVVAILARMSVLGAHLLGLGSEEAYFLQVLPDVSLNVQGLLLGGIILGALGVLDDIVVSQVSVVQQLHQANKKLSFAELYRRALEVGKDHVASLVNTLVLAYAGANLPLFLLFYLDETIPSWVTINNELVAEEIVRTLVGSMGLVLAVPIASFVAAYVVKETTIKVENLHAH